MDDPIFKDLAEFARIELASRDLEPWADLIGKLRHRGDIDTDGAYWLVKLYNAYDDMGSAWTIYRRWSGPSAWLMADDYQGAADYPLTQERRGLRGGKVVRHLISYHEHVARAGSQQAYVAAAPYGEHLDVLAYLSAIWGVGRQTSFEWAEFLAKACDAPARCATAADLMLWESEGPRRSIEALFDAPGGRAPDRAWLDGHATGLRAWLADEGVALEWEDFETVICDFHVGRHGRYYPGRHLAALREEIATVPDDGDRSVLEAAFRSVVPGPWRDIPPGIDKTKMPRYRDTGVWIDRP